MNIQACKRPVFYAKRRIHMTDLERKNAWLACPAMTEELRKELEETVTYL